MKRLEQNLGIPLIQRGVGRMELTPWTARLIEQLIQHKQGLGLIPLSVGERDQQMAEVSVEADRVLQRISLVLQSDYQASSVHVDLYELLRSRLRLGL